MPFKLIALILPLSLDSFAVSAALGVAGISRSERLRLSLLFAAFEGGMPIIGLVAGRLVSDAISSAADFVAIAILALVGIWMIRQDDDDLTADIVTRARGFGAIALAVSTSLDELAIGFTIGLLALPLVLVVILIACQAVLATQLGTRFGSSLAEVKVFGVELNEQAERASGVVLIGLALVLIGLRLSGHSA
jgi:manganese efflux pump family protein